METLEKKLKNSKIKPKEDRRLALAMIGIIALSYAGVIIYTLHNEKYNPPQTTQPTSQNNY